MNLSDRHAIGLKDSGMFSAGMEAVAGRPIFPPLRGVCFPESLQTEVSARGRNCLPEPNCLLSAQYEENAS